MSVFRFLKAPGTLPALPAVPLLIAAMVLAPPRAAVAQLSVSTQRPFVTALVPSAGFGAVGGIYIDADGMLRETASLSADDRLKLLRRQAFAKAPDSDVARKSELRKVSLRRLEETVRRLHAAGKPFPPEVRYLAGLWQLRYVFFYPEAQDVVLAGPAEAWRQTPSGEVVGIRSGRPVLHLDDLIVALRYAFAEETVDAFIGVSIEPTEEGINRHRAYVRKLRGRFEPSRAEQIFAGMAEAMGPQQIKLYGVEPSSRFAMKMVAADYRLKRIALDHDPAPVPDVTSYFDLAAKRGRYAAREPQHRWWFLARYDSIEHSPDNLAFELRGQGVQVVTERSYLADRQPKAEKRPASLAAEKFAASFTQHFSDVAKEVPVFAELQNLVALSVAAELIGRVNREVPTSLGKRAVSAVGGQRIARRRIARDAASGSPRSGFGCWRPTHLLDPDKCMIPSVPVPERVPSLVSYRKVDGRHWLISVSGGVEINPAKLAAPESLAERPSAALGTARDKQRPPVEVNRWWWD